MGGDIGYWGENVDIAGGRTWLLGENVAIGVQGENVAIGMQGRGT